MAHSSCCEARTAPTGRIIAARCGKIPATSVRRTGMPFHEEIAEVASFLVSPRASYVTGAIIAIDGGRTAI